MYVLQVYSEQIAKNFALIHSLEIPVSKDPTWIGDTIRYKATTTFTKNSLKFFK
jgi:hypothetical protein